MKLQIIVAHWLETGSVNSTLDELDYMRLVAISKRMKKVVRKALPACLLISMLGCASTNQDVKNLIHEMTRNETGSISVYSAYSWKPKGGENCQSKCDEVEKKIQEDENSCMQSIESSNGNRKVPLLKVVDDLRACMSDKGWELVFSHISVYS